jgi:hypothetical protein
MRWVLITLLLLSGLFSVHGQVFFSLPVNVSPSSAYGGYRPKIVIPEDGKPIVSWAKSGSGAGTFKAKWMGPAMEMFENPVSILPGTYSYFVGNIDGPEAITFNDTVLITMWNYADSISNIFLISSFDGGNTFVDTNLVYTTIKRVEFPSIALLGDGSLGIAFLRSETDETLPEILFTRSIDNGENWSMPANISAVNPGIPCECCPLKLSASATKTVVTYRNNVDTIRDFYAAVSDDFGLNFNTGFPIDTSQYWTFTCPTSGADSEILGDSLFSVYTTKMGSQYRVKFAGHHLTDTNGFNDFFLDTAVSHNYPTLAISNDTMAMVWQQTFSFTQDVYFSYRTSTLDWSEPVNITNASANQVTPDIAIANGMFHVVYFDQPTRPKYIRGKFSPWTTVNETSKEENNFLVYPNPSEGNVEIIGEGSFTLTDLTGKTICTGDVTTIKNRLTSAAAGSYLITNGSVTKKIIRL